MIHSRREFLKITGATIGAASAVGFWGCSTKQAIKDDKIPVGLQLYSVRQQMEQDVPGTLESVASIGYQGVEFAGFFDYSAKDLKKILDDNGLQCCGSHTQLDTLSDDQIKSTLEYNAAIGNTYLIVPWIPEEMRQSKEDWIKLADMFNALSEKVSKEGMMIGYHNHGFEFERMDGEYPWDIFAEHTDPRVILQLDTGNATHGGADALAVLTKYPGRAVTIHIKEEAESNPTAILGEGTIPWIQVLEFCRNKGGTEWYIIEEEKDMYPPLECVEMCYNNLNEIRS